MEILVYIHKMIYKFGGTESYTANFIEFLQDIFQNEKISMLTELYHPEDVLTSDQVTDRMNKAYGVNVDKSRFNIQYIKANQVELTSDSKRQKLHRKICSMRAREKVFFVSKKADLFINCSNMAVLGGAKLNLSVIHFPQEKYSKSGIYKRHMLLRFLARRIEKKYLNCYRFFMPNSQFTSGWLKEKWNVNDEKIRVFYPPVKTISKTQSKIKNQIFACGRIEASKKVDLMIKTFLSSEYLKNNCVLKIAGSSSYEDQSYIDYINSLKTDSVHIIMNPTRDELEEFYATSSVFWHAKGYGEMNPMEMEHFGITTVEAMSAGCIPVVINKGGQKEIVTSDCGYVWNEPEELCRFTEEIMKNSVNTDLMRENCIKRSKLFFADEYKKQLKKLFVELGIIS